MRTTFSLTHEDYRRLERVIARRLQDSYGRFNLSWFLQVFAWIFVTLAIVSFYKQWTLAPAEAAPFGAILAFSVLAFVLVGLRPWAGQRIFWKYLFDSSAVLTAMQSIEVRSGSLHTESSVARSEIPRKAVIAHCEDKHNHYLFLTGVQAIIIPKAAAAELGTALEEFLASPPSEA